MPGTIRIGNDGFRSTIKTDSSNNLVLSTPNSENIINFFSGSSEEGNVIRFIQNVSASVKTAIVHVSSSNAGNGGYNIDTPFFDRITRANRDLYVTSPGAAIFQTGLSSGSTGVGYEINNSIAFGNANRRIFIEDRTHNSNSDKIHLSGSVVVSGSLKLNGSTITAGGGGTPGGSNTQVQFNNGGSFGGDSDLVWNSTTNALTINGTLNATRKSFVVNHQKMDNHNLVHGSLEGPEFGAYIRGKVENDNKIALPDYWEWLVDEDSITVHITPIGYHILPLYFKEIKDNYVYVNKKTNFYYYICAERKDIEKLKIIEKK
tara:strand:- start:1106 stop:2059 length:954 start_codon:yes stop_codon:yes gene_type:complete